MDRERILSNIRVAAVNNFNESPEDIVAKALAPVSTRIRTILPDVNLLRSLVKRCRNSTGTTLMGHIANSELLEAPSKEERVQGEVEEPSFKNFDTM